MSQIKAVTTLLSNNIQYNYRYIPQYLHWAHSIHLSQLKYGRGLQGFVGDLQQTVMCVCVCVCVHLTYITLV